jgi:hypothetical protein
MIRPIARPVAHIPGVTSMEASMGTMTKRAVVGVLVGCVFSLFGERIDRDVVLAQRRTPIVATRIFTGPDGKTHAEQVDVKLTGGATELSDMVKVSGLQFRRQAPNYFQDWHRAPRRQYVITLSGRGEVELDGGQKIPLGPGHILLAEDVTGKGHISRGVGTEDRISLFIPLADQ